MKDKAPSEAPPGHGPILHLDMDAFYAAVEVLDFPELKGKPVVVGSPPDKRGVVSTASYEARRFGIHSAMPSRTAGKLCPHAVFRPVRMDRYVEVSHQVMSVVESFTPVVEQVSVDEAFLDVRGVMRRWKSGRALAEALKARIRQDIHLTCSVGVAPNKYLAKLASDLHKPDGLTVAPSDPADIPAFLAPLPVGRIWGVGKVTEARLAECGIMTMGDVQRMDPAVLRGYLGAHSAAHIHALAFGLDDRPVVTEYEAKSISSETTFDEDCTDMEVVRQVLVSLAEQVGARLRGESAHARVGHIKVRRGDFSTLTRQRPFTRVTRTDRDLVQCALHLWTVLRMQGPIRLIGFGVSGLGEGGVSQPELGLGPFTRDPDPVKAERLDGAVDAVRKRFGSEAIRRGATLQAASARPPRKPR